MFFIPLLLKQLDTFANSINNDKEEEENYLNLFYLLEKLFILANNCNYTLHINNLKPYLSILYQLIKNHHLIEINKKILIIYYVVYYLYLIK